MPAHREGFGDVLRGPILSRVPMNFPGSSLPADIASLVTGLCEGRALNADHNCALSCVSRQDLQMKDFEKHG